MDNGKAVLFTGGLGPKREQVSHVLDDTDITIAADSGWDLAVGMGIIPDYYIGDMDSISDHDGLRDLPPERVIIYPEKKDYSDTELALKFLEDKHFRDIVLIGGGGGRIDHLLALKALFSRPVCPVEWFTAAERIVYVNETCSLPCNSGQTVSFFSCSGEQAVVSTKGMEWELSRYELDDSSFSLSNTALGACVEVVIHSGAILIMFNY